MEHEDREEIPWSSLIPESTHRTDRRWYVAGAAMVILLSAWFGYRLWAGGVQPQPPPSDLESAPTSAAGAAPIAPPPTMVVAEEDLVGAASPDDRLRDRIRLVGIIAEWFVTDYYTVDGSAETRRSVVRALGSGLVDSELPHDQEGPDTFVEWARAVTVDAADSPFEARVLFRTIRSDGDGFVRDGVRAVVVHLDEEDGRLVVIDLPRPLDPEVATREAMG